MAKRKLGSGALMSGLNYQVAIKVYINQYVNIKWKMNLCYVFVCNSWTFIGA